jgi:hypothetical protein
MATNRIPEFIEALRSAETPEAVSEQCKLEENYLDTELATSSKKRAFTRYRNAIKENFEGTDTFKHFVYTDKNGQIVVDEYGKYIFKVFRLSKKELGLLGEKETNQIYNRHTKKRRERGFVSANDIICKAEELVDISTHKRVSYGRLAIGLMVLTGRRDTEIVKTASFKKLSEGTQKHFEQAEKLNLNEDDCVIFSGQLKTKESKNANLDPYVIPVLGDVDTIIEALRKLREIKDCTKLTNDEVHSQVNPTLNESIKRVHFKGLLVNPSCSIMRKIYCAICQKWFYDENQSFKLEMSKQKYLASILGHTEKDFGTANSYKDYEDLIID